MPCTPPTCHAPKSTPPTHPHYAPYAASYESDVAAKAHRSCPDAYLQAARAGDRAKARTSYWGGQGA